MMVYLEFHRSSLIISGCTLSVNFYPRRSEIIAGIFSLSQLSCYKSCGMDTHTHVHTCVCVCTHTHKMNKEKSPILKYSPFKRLFFSLPQARVMLLPLTSQLNALALLYKNLLLFLYVLLIQIHSKVIQKIQKHVCNVIFLISLIFRLYQNKIDIIMN